MPEIFINGQAIEAREDQTVLQVAREHGIFVPYFCWNSFDTMKAEDICCSVSPLSTSPTLCFRPGVSGVRAKAA